MKWFLGQCAIWVLIVLGRITGSEACFEEERLGLLEFKAFIKSNGADADHLLPTWVGDDRESECCNWERVTCNKTTGHVIELFLENVKEIAFADYRTWVLNASLFLPFKELKSLNLSGNHVDCCTEKEGFKRLRKLEALDLGSNYLENNIFRSLGALTSLKTLIVGSNGLGGYFPAHELVALENLEMLDISDNSYHGSLPMLGFERLSILRKLETLYLDFNQFNNSILLSLSTLTYLRVLSLGGNNLWGSFPAHEVANFENLENLDLSNNELSDTSTIQGCESLSRLKGLETISLAYNRFNKSVILCLSALPSLKNLYLGVNELGGSFSVQDFSVLEKLEVLDLSYNRLDSLTIKDSQRSCNLSKLRHLDLSGNYFNKDILKSLGALSSLKFISLASSAMEGPISNEELTNLPSLEVLILKGNSLNGTLPMQGLASFHNLEILDLSGNNFAGSIPPSIRALTSLKALSLARNNLNGSLPTQGLCELKKLQELDLGENNFKGVLPPCLNNLTSLRLFDLSLNQFTGNLSLSLIASLTSLEYIDLSHNHFKGLFSFSSFSNHSKLEVVEIISDNTKFEVETEYSDWIPIFQLKVLVLSNCNLNQHLGDVPKFLLHQRKLRVLDLSHNSLEGRFPQWLLENNTRLQFLNLRNNSFIGLFHLPTCPNINTNWMDISDNNLSGQIQADIGQMLLYPRYLNFSRNAFDGGIPLSISNMSQLEKLDLSINNFSGEVPKKLVTDCDFLSVLLLSHNRFHGQIMSTNFSLTKLSVLQLDNNQFTGKFSNVFTGGLMAIMLDISNNFFSGVIPSSIGNTTLSAVVMRNNLFEGPFPCELVPSLFLDISHNSFSGYLPSCSNLQYLKHLHLESNRFSGSIPQSFRNLSDLLTLDISDNSLSGRIPNFIGELSNLRMLLVRGNHFTGSIPEQLCQLRNISLMDLSINSLSGSIPHCLPNITGPNDLAFTHRTKTMFMGRSVIYSYGSILDRHYELHDTDDIYVKQEEVEFVTKSRLGFYKGGILDLMSGLDLSYNNFTGEIPEELGMLIQILALNLSHNQLSGPIPKRFSNLKQIESLDLSFNRLSGEIPLELIDLNFLEVFTVAHNNLSGRVPEMKAQFGTFAENSYEGNPFLCGPPLEKNCTTIVNSPSSSTASSDESEEKWYEIDMVHFYASFIATYIVFLLGFATLLYINPYWRRRWFHLIEECTYSCYYFLYDSLRKLSALFA